MQSIVQCCVILRNMSIDMDSELLQGSNGVQAEGSGPSVTVGVEVPYMWETGTLPTNTSVAPGSIAAICRTKAFTGNVEAHLETKRLLVDHLWNVHGST